jgi:hypothetical protein
MATAALLLGGLLTGTGTGAGALADGGPPFQCPFC